MRFCRVQNPSAPYRPGDQILYSGVLHLWFRRGWNLHHRHPSGARNFEMAARVLENMRSCILIDFVT